MPDFWLRRPENKTPKGIDKGITVWYFPEMDKLLEYLNSLSTEQRSSFAVRCETSEGYLRKAVSVKQRLGESLCINVERETKGAITCESLRPDVDWAYLRKTCKQKAA